MANKIANRKVICDTLLEAAKTDKDIVVLCSDSRGSASLTPFFDQYPQQSVEVGIAEQDLVSIAAGMASCGKKAWAASPASFVTTRSYEQCKVDVSYSNTNVKLIGISGVGPKAALAILSVCTPQGLAMAVITGDEKALIAAPGIGKKIAQRIILELKDKLAKEQQEIGMPTAPGIVAGEKSKAVEAAAALAVLGYTQQDIAVAMKGVDVENLPLEEIVRQSLKKMVK